jgi:hypothetical protein
MGGFTVYLTHEQDFGKEYKRFPHNGTGAGIRIGDFHFLDPTGEGGAELARAFASLGPFSDG